MIDERVKVVIAPESEKINKKLKKVEGFIDVNEKLKEIKANLSKELTENPDYEDFANRLAELVESHKFFSSKGQKEQ